MHQPDRSTGRSRESFGSLPGLFISIPENLFLSTWIQWYIVSNGFVFFITSFPLLLIFFRLIKKQNLLLSVALLSFTERDHEWDIWKQIKRAKRRRKHAKRESWWKRWLREQLEEDHELAEREGWWEPWRRRKHAKRESWWKRWLHEPAERDREWDIWKQIKRAKRRKHAKRESWWKRWLREQLKGGHE